MDAGTPGTGWTMGIDRKAVAAEAKRRSLADDGKTSHAERFALRNVIRAEQGYAPEQRTRGGLAGVYDRNKDYIAPIAALGALAIPGVGPALSGALGSVGSAVTGALGGLGSAVTGAIPALGNLGGLGGAVKQGADWLLKDNGRNALGAIAAVDAASQRRRADNLTNRAVGLDTGRWRDAAPLRDAGMSGLLNPVPVDTSRLAALGSQGNPFAGPSAPPPAPVPTGAASVDGAPMAPIPVRTPPRVPKLRGVR